ncbi:hypothetical protein PAHAL_4G349900 [Panicum hallii]|uniref:Uncharacterized protein n=1 Tax=Panicum hallii TaxID=206008 RepID=A0A2T8JF31_9POAL|nr:hypothetical protein PAHAL_4G349900 [Panicum hallii]
MSPWRDLLWVIPAFVAPIPSVTSSSVVSLQPILFLLQLQRRPTAYRDRRARDVDGGDHAGAGRPCVAGSLPARGAADGRGEPGRPQRPESTESCEVALVYGAAPAVPLLPVPFVLSLSASLAPLWLLPPACLPAPRPSGRPARVPCGAALAHCSPCVACGRWCRQPKCDD